MTLEKFAEIFKDLSGIKSMHEDFIRKHSEDIGDFTFKDSYTEEEYLIMEVLFGITCKLVDIANDINVFTSPITSTGTITKKSDGFIYYNDKPLLAAEKLELMIESDEYDIGGWTRAVVAKDEDGYFLIGIPRNVDINGVKARMRSSESDRDK